MDMHSIAFVAHDPSWHHRFEKEKPLLKSLFLQNFVGAHHVGSTAIPGLRARPILDILVIVKSVHSLEPKQIRSFGFFADGSDVRYTTARRDTMLYIVEHKDPLASRMLLQHEYLLTHPHEVEAYDALKGAAEDLRGYTAAKERFFAELAERAALWKEKMCE